jgi:3-oxoacyl-[acyl-carrier protein] reductase
MCKPVSIVTGGRRGIGRAIGLCLADRGHNVLVVDLEHDAAADETIALLKQRDVDAAFFAADVGNECLHENILAAADRLGTVTTLVNNAGVSSTERSVSTFVRRSF